MDLGELPGYRLALRGHYDDLYGNLTPEAARAREDAAREYVDHLLDALDLPDEGAALDLGCGDGLLARAIARRRPRIQVLGLDTATAALALARTLAAREGLANAHFQEGDADAPPDAHFDRIVAASIFNLLPDKAAALRAWRRAITPDGLLVLADALDAGGPGTLGTGAASAAGLTQAARLAGWRPTNRHDLTPLVAKLHAARAWPWPEYVRPGYRYVALTLRPAAR